jgi:hypothetical protein
LYTDEPTAGLQALGSFRVELGLERGRQDLRVGTFSPTPASRKGTGV